MSSSLAKTILQGTVNGKRRKGRQKKRLEDKSKSGQGWTLPAQLGQLKTKQDGKLILHVRHHEQGFLKRHLYMVLR